jgi:hypothetical protein
MLSNENELWKARMMKVILTHYPSVQSRASGISGLHSVFLIY